MSAHSITQKLVVDLLVYSPQTGVFTWLPRGREQFSREQDWKTFSARYANKPAGGYDVQGYVVISIYRRAIKAHRLAWLYIHGVWPSREIDHINGVRDDNRIENLRDVSHTHNIHNTKRPRHDNISQRVGVGFRSGRQKFRARICVAGTTHHLGVFSTAEAAHAAYVAAKKRLHSGYVLG